MCFRPSSASLPVKCPNCDYLNKGGSTTCLKCGADLPVENQQSADAAMPGSPAAPSAPGAPGAPAAPGAPGNPNS